MNELCLKPDCGRPVLRRGLCSGCYIVATRLIRKEKTSWQKLIKAGKALPRKTNEGKTSAVEWFLS